MLIKITLGVHLLLGIDSVIKNLFNVLNAYTKRSVHLPLNSKRYKEFNLLHVLLFSIFCWASWPRAKMGGEGKGEKRESWLKNKHVLHVKFSLTKLFCLSCLSVSLSVSGLRLSL